MLLPEDGKHFLIIGHKYARTLCGWPIFAFYPVTESGRINGRGDIIGVTMNVGHVTCRICSRILNVPTIIEISAADVRQT